MARYKEVEKGQWLLFPVVLLVSSQKRSFVGGKCP